MRKAGLALLFVLGLLAAGGLSAGVVAATTTSGTTTTGTTPAVIAEGVTISGVDVGGLTSSDAYTAVSESFARPVVPLPPSLLSSRQRFYPPSPFALRRDELRVRASALREWASHCGQRDSTLTAESRPPLVASA